MAVYATDRNCSNRSILRRSGDNQQSDRRVSKSLFWQRPQLAERRICEKNCGPEEFKACADTVRSEEETNLYNAFLKTHSPNDEAAKCALFRLNRNHFLRMTTYPNSHRMALMLKESEWNVPISYYKLRQNQTHVRIACQCRCHFRHSKQLSLSV